eukprot:TRINITY_DN60897_c0_g1_i1.p1 TRINITY_DN60897_c0_g1~~TRINITY_DN60897_c0_g1_i1.p1  ORF type:complete len:577 (+),score=62.87 TRINITY_DN60897_c0_g1_i1:196-1926(+)
MPGFVARTTAAATRHSRLLPEHYRRRKFGVAAARLHAVVKIENVCADTVGPTLSAKALTALWAAAVVATSITCTIASALDPVASSGPAAASCAGFGVSPEEWEYVVYLAEVAAQNPLPWDGKQFLHEICHRLEQLNLLSEASASCPGEIFSALAQSLMVVETTVGEAAMGNVLRRARDIAPTVPQNVGWTVESQLAWAAWYPMRNSAATCRELNRPRVFVYETGKLAQRPLYCSAGMEGVEVLVHHFLLRSSCRVYTPDEADFFFAPFYSFCYQNSNLQPGNEVAQLDALHQGLIKGLAYFTEERRHQHIFLFAHEFWDFLSWRRWVSQSTLFVVEANPLEYPTGDIAAPPRHCIDCFVPVKDVVLPGHTDHWTTRQMVELALPFESRPFLACYHGAFAHRLYDEAVSPPPFNRTAGQVREVLAWLAETGDGRLSVGHHLRPVRRYYERLGQCRFCLIPKGVGFTNGRLMETFFTGCVPVILSDAMVVPFDELLEWRSFSIKWPMMTTYAESLDLIEYLAKLPQEVSLDLHGQLLAHQCWFDYTTRHDERCSPYEGIMKLLHRRKRPQPRRYWRPH